MPQFHFWAQYHWKVEISILHRRAKFSFYDLQEFKQICELNLPI